ncbi:tail fiber domain-containing protein [Pseudomonas sp. ESBL2]|uniref:tail fiber domain-containing protein n=1 Tax=Pseudomonas sp. ESBL2 TaxID=3077325 RepID=UPI002FC8058D
MRYNTGNPVEPDGSSSPFDLHDNAGNIDLAANGDAPTWIDRKGKVRKSFAGMEQGFELAQAEREYRFNSDQELRASAFEAQMSTMAYELPAIPYAGGVNISRVTQVIERDGEFYRAKPGSVPFITTGSWPTDLNKLIYIGDAVLRGDLARRDAIFVEDFGAVPGDLAASNGDAFRQAFLACAVRKKSKIYGFGNIYAFQNDHLRIPDGITFEGSGHDHWDVKASWRPRKMEAGTTLLFCGTPSDTVQVVNVSNMRVAGGVVANDAPEGFSGNENYSLLDFTNGDSTGADPATPKNLRVAVSLGNDAHLENCRVQLNYNGVDGYNSVELLPEFPEYTTSYNGFGDGYDIGVLTYNKMDTGVKGVQVVGYWRMVARAVIASNYDDARWFGGCVFHDEDIFYQGFYGFSCRSNDVHRITAIDATSVSVPWNASHTVPRSGKVWLGNTPCTYTSTSVVGGMIVLTGFSVTPSALSSVGKECFFGTHPGFAISSIRNGTITGMNHFTNRRPYDTALTTPTANPGGCFEISGNPLRHIEFENIHFFDVDVIGFLKDTLHISFKGCDAEAQGFTGMVGTAKGARFIASAPIDDANAHGAYPAGATGGVTWDASGSMGDGSVDLKPFQSSTLGRHPGTAKYFMPDTMLWSPQAYWVNSLETRRRYNVGMQLIAKGLEGSEVIEMVTPGFARMLRLNASNLRAGFGGLTNPVSSIHHQGAAESSARLQTTDAGAEPAFYWQNSLGTWDARPSLANKWYLRYGSAIKLQVDASSGSLNAGAHNAGDIGSAGNSYRTGYFATAIGGPSAKVPNGYFGQVFTDSGAVAVSDMTKKQDIEEIPDSVLNAWELVEYRQYRLKDSVAAKGEDARTHLGVMAQRVEEAFLSAGVDPFKYGILCIDEWDAQYEPIMGVREVTYQVEVGEGDEAVLEDRIRQEEYDTGEVRLVYEAGSQYGVRYEQALVLEAALMRRRYSELEARIKALESK